MTETMDQNDNLSKDGKSEEDQPDDNLEIIELTDIFEGVVADDGQPYKSLTSITPEKGLARDDGNLISDDAIEAALLRIVEKKYARQLDALFVEAVERVVEREIAAIKQSLLKDF